MRYFIYFKCRLPHEVGILFHLYSWGKSRFTQSHTDGNWGKGRVCTQVIWLPGLALNYSPLTARQCLIRAFSNQLTSSEQVKSFSMSHFIITHHDILGCKSFRVFPGSPTRTESRDYLRGRNVDEKSDISHGWPAQVHKDQVRPDEDQPQLF